jgi:MFS superfamily sulfate permease-like transporter
MGILNQIAEYLYLKKKDPNAPSSKWVKYMHGINRISILLFLLGLLILAIKLFWRSR